MKKKLLIVLFTAILIFTGCSRDGKSNVVDKLDKKINSMDAYQITGVLSITNNEDTYNYNVKASYKKDDNYRVSLINKSNNHEQIILKSNNEVYVMTHKSTQLLKSNKFEVISI